MEKNRIPIPSNITFPSVSTGGMDILWDCDISKLSEAERAKIIYYLEIKEAVGNLWRVAYQGNAKMCSPSGLDKDTEYNVRVKCVIGKLHGEWSDVGSVWTKGMMIQVATLPTLSNITFPSVSTRGMEISWDCDTSKVSEADKGGIIYYVEAKEAEGSTWRVVYQGIENKCSASGLDKDTEYNVRVKCVIREHHGEWSDVASVRTKNTIIESAILASEKDGDIFEGKLFEWCKSKDFELLYRGTRDGFKAKDFHRTCDGKGKTLVLIKNICGHIFGGFATSNWESFSFIAHGEAPGSFIFTLSNMYGIQPTKFPLKKEKDDRAIFCTDTFGPIFGNGHDILVKSDCDKSAASWVGFGGQYDSYRDTTGKGSSIFTSSTSTGNFQAREIEVFKVNV